MKENETGIRLAVHFEKKGAKSALVKPENLRIAFEIPQVVLRSVKEIKRKLSGRSRAPSI